MPNSEFDFSNRPEPPRRCSSLSDDERLRRREPKSRRHDEVQNSDRRHRKRDGSRSNSHRSRRRHDYEDSSIDRRRRHSGSPPPEASRSSHRDDGKYSRRERSASHSSPPKRKRYAAQEDREYSSHHRAARKHVSTRSRSRSPHKSLPPSKRSKAPLPSQNDAFKGNPDSTAKDDPSAEPEKQKPNFAPTGKLAAETNTVASTSIILKYNEPPDSRLPPPSSTWRLYVFKGSDVLDTILLHTRSCWLFGREQAVVDYATEHPSCSKQHAVLQFRYVEKRDEWGERKGAVKPYVIDLDSANGTKVNGEKVPERRFVEIRSGDVITFGESSREYTLLLPPKEEKKC